jgi:hypothetical protein
MDDGPRSARSGLLGPLGRLVLGRSGVAYLAICAGLAALTFFPAEPIPWAFPALFIATLPTSPFAWVLSVYGGILVFGVDEGLIPRLVLSVFWMALATGQLLALRWAIRSSISTKRLVTPSATRRA